MHTSLLLRPFRAWARVTQSVCCVFGRFAPGRVVRGAFFGFHEPDSEAHTDSRGKRMSPGRASLTRVVAPVGVSVRV